MKLHFPETSVWGRCMNRSTLNPRTFAAHSFLGRDSYLMFGNAVKYHFDAAVLS